MRLAVVAYPAFSDEDRRWVEGIRARFDPKAAWIAAHVTLVFPADLPAAAVVAGARRALGAFASMPVVFGRAAARDDPVGGGHYVALLAEEGQRELTALHDALHDAIATGRRPDIPFVPHVTVAAGPDRVHSERIADELNAGRRIVRTRIAGVHVIEVGEAMVRTVAALPLT
jgi:2'-5' RNA ligase